MCNLAKTVQFIKAENTNTCQYQNYLCAKKMRNSYELRICLVFYQCVLLYLAFLWFHSEVKNYDSCVLRVTLVVILHFEGVCRVVQLVV